MSKSLLKDVSVEELKQMSESGMSHQDIANALGTTYMTIYRYLGPQGRRGSRRAAGIPLPKANEPAPVEDTSYSPCLVVQNKSIELHGLLGTYYVDCKNAKFRAELETSLERRGQFVMEIDKLDDLINELQAIKRKASDLTVANEMW